MENRFQTSFIPKRPMIPGTNEPVRRKGPPSFLIIVGVIVFVFTLATSGGLFFYKKSLVAGNADKKAKVEEAIRNFEPELTKQLTVLKARIDNGKQLLGNHIAFSSILTLLGSITAQTVRFTELTYNYTIDPISKEQKASIGMKGDAINYSAVAFQSDIFSKNENLRNPIFSDLNLNEKGLIVFNVKADVDPKSILYKRTLAENPALEPVSTSTSTLIEEEVTNQPGS